jgi:hypothetical protein
VAGVAREHAGRVAAVAIHLGDPASKIGAVAKLAIVAWIIRPISIPPQHEAVELISIGGIHPALEVEDIGFLRVSAADHPVLKLRQVAGGDC